MILENLFEEPALTEPLDSLCIRREGEGRQEQETLLLEHSMKVTLSTGEALSFVCLPQYLPELILGHLAAEGYIEKGEDVEKLRIDPTGQKAEVILKPDCAPRSPEKAAKAFWEKGWIFALADRFAQGMPLHSRTFATHSCFLARQDTLLFQCEDIGRHNALDKAIGYAQLNGICLGECIVYSSGRMPGDMVKKAIRSGIGVMVSKGSPTARGVARAREAGLTLICNARSDRMKLFSGE